MRPRQFSDRPMNDGITFSNTPIRVNDLLGITNSVVFVPSKPDKKTKEYALLNGIELHVCKIPRLDFCRAIAIFEPNEPRISRLAHVDKRFVTMGSNVRILQGACVGQPGFGYERDESDKLISFPHTGRVVLGNDVHVGAGACIDRGSIGDTVICDGVKIDNLVHIAHNVFVGEDTAIIAHAMIAGSVTIGKRAWIAPHAVIREGVTIGNCATVGLGAVVTKDVPAGVTVIGVPAKIMK